MYPITKSLFRDALFGHNLNLAVISVEQSLKAVSSLRNMFSRFSRSTKRKEIVTCTGEADGPRFT